MKDMVWIDIEYDSENLCCMWRESASEASTGGTNVCSYCDVGMGRLISR